MKNVGEFTTGVVGTSVSATSTALQTSEVLQIVQLIITIVAGLVTILVGLYSWYKNAKKDGKITQDEIEEGVEIIQNGVNGIKENLDKNKKEGE